MGDLVTSETGRLAHLVQEKESTHASTKEADPHRATTTVERPGLVRGGGIPLPRSIQVLPSRGLGEAVELQKWVRCAPRWSLRGGRAVTTRRHGATLPDLDPCAGCASSGAGRWQASKRSDPPAVCGPSRSQARGPPRGAGVGQSVWWPVRPVPLAGEARVHANPEPPPLYPGEVSVLL